MVRDPVCNMEVNERMSTAKSIYKDKTFHFCARTCKIEFDKNPEKFIKRPEPVRRA